ncbi:glycosyl hydrolase catalytic core-domain-containing protein [Epithele typhae]|uniref:glycosyl hydrolase catalytic core-domain-containing protein n=1 Tax=Epithele typhae TaxID=378194 RepID=UPI0020084B3C|nr:glycosyl hydrolase catalytic core-domain-containing protein [Epithele typhae]KAH9943067.1 glycosyl hydrolase catalytic core-domain-containing protein [Epithele typhae]
MASKLLSLVSLSTLAILAASFGPEQVTALSSHGHLNRRVEHHAPLARKKRDSTTRCRARATTSSAVATSSSSSSSSKAEATTTKEAATTSTKAAATTKTSTSKASTSTGTSSSGGAGFSNGFGTSGHKIGLAWGMGNSPSVLSNFVTDHVVAIYDWSPSKPSGTDEHNLVFMPMLWDDAGDKISAFHSAMKSFDKSNTLILGFNEINEPGQANMSGEQAAAVWKAQIEQYCSAGFKCATPSMSSRPNGNQLMRDFFNACNGGCTVSHMALHWYDTTFDKLTTYLEAYHDEFKLPILLTEFADQNFNGGGQASMSDIWSFMTQVIPWVDKTDWMELAAPFGVMTDLQGVNTLNALLSGNAKTPTDLGYYVINNGN